MANFNFNKVILGGRLVGDPELKQTTGGIPVTSFSIAVNRKPTKNSEQRQADFINCVAWRNTAEFISKYFHKGNAICIVGNLQSRSWNDNQGVKRYATEVIIEEANFVESASDNKGNTSYSPYSSEAASFGNQDEEAPKFEEMINDDDLPF